MKVLGAYNEKCERAAANLACAVRQEVASVYY